MSSRSPRPKDLTRRQWTALLAASPLLAQAPAPLAPKVQNANADVQQTSQRLAEIELPMNIEPAFRFTA
ncbi:MAG TPA: hypothetical protein VGL97_00510 [Bryobacteraceae bacterium]|jgi:hypothetical protein